MSEEQVLRFAKDDNAKNGNGNGNGNGNSNNSNSNSRSSASRRMTVQAFVNDGGV